MQRRAAKIRFGCNGAAVACPSRQTLGVERAPMSDSAEQNFRRGVRVGLAKLDSQIEGVLRSLVSYEYPPEVFAL